MATVHIPSGLGVRSANDLALPTFLASVTASVDFISQLLPFRLRNITDPAVISAQNAWTSLTCAMSLSTFQQCTEIMATIEVEIWQRDVSCTISSRSSPVSCGCIISSGDFLNAIPCSSVGTRLDNSSFRIATALRLGAPICAPHQCVCGENVDQYGVHCLSCRRSAGRHSRHITVNDLIKRALTAADSRQTGAVVSVTEWWQASRWLDIGAMVTRQVLRVGLHLSRHSGHKPSASSVNCCLHSRSWRRGPQMSEISDQVLFCSTFHLQLRHYGLWEKRQRHLSGTLVAALLSPLASRDPLSFCSNVWVSPYSVGIPPVS